MGSHGGTSDFLTPMTREEALLMFRKLRAEDSTIWCMGDFPGFNFALTGKVRDNSGEGVKLVSLEGEVEILLRLPTIGPSFWYTEPSAFPSEIFQAMRRPAKDSVFVCALFPTATEGGEAPSRPGKVLLCELREESKEER